MGMMRRQLFTSVMPLRSPSRERAGLVSGTPAQGAVDHVPQVVSRGLFGIELSAVEPYEVTPVRVVGGEKVVLDTHELRHPRT